MVLLGLTDRMEFIVIATPNDKYLVGDHKPTSGTPETGIGLFFSGLTFTSIMINAVAL